MNPLLLLLALAQATAPPNAQGVPPQGAPAQERDLQGPPVETAPQDLKLRNGIYLVVNEEVVTLAEFYREMRRSRAEITLPEDRERLEIQKRVGFLREMLMIQAGRDLGFDPERVKALVEEDRSELIERSGSVTAFSEKLREQRVSPEELRQQREDYYYGLLWRAAVSGESQGAGGRPYVDRFVRPGRLLYEYRRQPAHQILPETVRIQEISLAIGDQRGAQETKELAVQIRERALAGEDFGQLAASYSNIASRLDGGRVPGPIPVERAVEVLPELAEFFRRGRAGDVSEPQPVRDGGTGELVGFQLLRLEVVDRPGEVELVEAKVQDVLRRRRVESLSRRRVDDALVELFDAAYVWPKVRVDAEGEQAGAAPPASR